ncbi:MAG: branched-chain amino acid ABC transporter permease [Microvirga sp.]|nr:branched-chain amino acid ABC transporter permease [Microvirga sp.]
MKNWLILLAGTGALALLPLLGDNYLMRLATMAAMYVVLAQSWNFIGGLAGYPSFATAGFFGLGAYASAVLQGMGVPIFVSWAAGGVAAVIFSALVGGAILHLRGHYFAIASLVTVEVLREIVNTTPDLTGGGMGLNLPIMRMSVAEHAIFFYYSMLVLAFACMACAIVVHKSKLGFGLRCIQQNEDAANILGVNAYLYKTVGFGFSAVFAGIAGAIYASWVHYIEPPDVFDVLLSVKPLVMVLLGGLGTIFGPAIGAFLLLTFEEFVWRTFLTVHAAALGIIIVALVLFLPNGVLSLTREKLGLRRRAGGEKR